MSTQHSDMNHHHQSNASRSNTLNRRNSNLMAMNHNIIPPPDVTHTTKMMPPQIMSSGVGSLYSSNNSKPNNLPPGILKDPKRNQQNQLNNVHKDHAVQSILMPMPSIVMSDGTLSNAHQLSAAQLMNNYDATNANVNLNLSNFNHQMGFPEGSVDGHLV